MRLSYLLSLLPLSLALEDTQLPWKTPPNVTVLTQSKVDQWWVPAWWSAGVYCSSASVQDWKCGPACQALKKPSRVITGGDGGKIPRFLIATVSPDTIILSVSGTNATNRRSVDIDLDFQLSYASDSWFPGSTRKGIQLHNGFYQAFQRIAPSVVTELDYATQRGVKTVIVTGHSMGGALGYLLGTYIQKLYPTLTVYIRVFAPPRVGNKAWANYVDDTFGLRAQHMVNFRDTVPHVPGRDWGYWRPSFEVWQLPGKKGKSPRYWLCGGQENKDCSDQVYNRGQEAILMSNFIFQFGVPEHLGPYLNVTVSSETCLEQ